jgi:hypothetical protein
MSKSHLVRRGAGVIIAVVASLFGVVLCAPSAFALVMRPVDSGSPTVTPPPAPAHGLVAAGMAGWQVALIAIGTAFVVATIAVITDRAWQAHRMVIVSAA